MAAIDTTGSFDVVRLHRLLFERLDEVLKDSETSGRIPAMWDGATSERVIQALINYPTATTEAEPKTTEPVRKAPSMAAVPAL